MKKLCFILLSLFLTLPIVFTSCSMEHSEEETYNILWEKINSVSNCEIAFLGDSITYMGGFESEFSEYNCLNLGICGDTILDVLNRINMVYALSPKKLFLMIGVNSLCPTQENIELCIKQYEEIIKSLKTNAPNTKLFIESVLPTSIPISNNVIDKFNIELKKLTEKYELDFIDLNSLYRDKNGLKQSYTTDGVHLHPSAYTIWYEKIREYL